VRCLHLTDAWSAGRVEAPDLFKAAAALHRNDVDAIAIRGIGVLTAAAQQLGWRRRPLDAPIFWSTAAHAARMEQIVGFYSDNDA
jgi:hypothetical protein